MAHSFSALYFHIIFSTKNREPRLTPDFKPRLFDYMGGILRARDASSLLINGPTDHIHMLVKIPPKLALADLIRDVKGDSSLWVHDTLRKDFGWQTGYAAFTVSISMTDAVLGYIAKQDEHHRYVSFQEEYLDFLKRHRIEYDPRFVFEGEFAG